MDNTQPNQVDPQLHRSADQETRLIRKVAFYAFLLNLALAIMKGLLALLSNSLAVTAGAIDSGTDAAASLVLYGGLRLSTRKTPSFPLGLYKIENFISVIVGLFIFFAGYEIALQAVTAARSAPKISAGVIILLSVGVLVIYFFGAYAKRVGRRTESPSLIAEGTHRMVDVLSSVIVIVSTVMSYFGLELNLFGISVDQIAAGVVVVFIAWAGWELLVDGMRVLLDASVDFETLSQVKKILEDHPMVVKVTSLVGRSAGRFRFLQTTVIMRTDDLQKAHQISESLESDIREKVSHVERVMIHYEPQPRTHTRIAVPLADLEGSVSDHFGSSPFFAFVVARLEDREEEKREVIENPYREIDSAKGIRVAEWLVQQDTDQVVMREDLSRKGPGYVLANAGIKSHITSANTIDKAIEEVLSPYRTK